MVALHANLTEAREEKKLLFSLSFVIRITNLAYWYFFVLNESWTKVQRYWPVSFFNFPLKVIGKSTFYYCNFNINHFIARPSTSILIYF